jgi:hypothetical protein
LSKKNPFNSSHTNGTSSAEADHDDHDVPSSSLKHLLHVPEEAIFESEEEEEENESPDFAIVQSIDLGLNTEVVHIAVPNLPSLPSFGSTDNVPGIFEEYLVFAVACRDHSIRLVSIPKTPPSNVRKMRRDLNQHNTRYGEEILTVLAPGQAQQIARSLTLTWTSRDWSEEAVSQDELKDDPDRMDEGEQDDPSRRQYMARTDEFDLLLAFASTETTGAFTVIRIPIGPKAGKNAFLPAEIYPYPTEWLSSKPVSISFSSANFPHKRHTELALVDADGLVRLYLPSKSLDEHSSEDTEYRWVPTVAFGTEFKLANRSEGAAQTAALRKRVVDAKWVSGGSSIILLLADGEWGVWDVNSNSVTSEFAFGGHLGGAPSSLSSSSMKPRNINSSLAPMTPKSRRVKEESLFRGTPSYPSQSSSHIARGGISVSNGSSATSDDTIVIWYNDEVYRIANLRQYWAKSKSGNTGGLYGQAVAKMEGIDIQGEMITCADLFNAPDSTDPATTRDILVVAEHRLVIMARARFQAMTGHEEREERITNERLAETDIALLSRRELDLGGIDRMLDDMAAGQVDAPRNRRVGFAP